MITEGDMTTRYISVRQAIELLNGAVSRSFLYKLVAEGKLRGTNLAGKVLVDADHLDELLAAGLSGPQPPAGVAQLAQETPADVEASQPPTEDPKGRAKRQGGQAGLIFW
jgi:excisionase family DNA binding protein